MFTELISVDAFINGSSLTDQEADDGGGGGDTVQLTFGKGITGALLVLVIVFTLVGNSLVVTAVVSYRRLRSVTNYFIVSLAVADLTVAVFVMPYSVLYEMSGRWRFGWIFCYFWISCDVTCCTASILHLCVISLDRYLAITEPLTYRARMSKRRALLAIAAVWLCSGAISFVPIYLGWFVDPDQMALYQDGPTCGLYVNKIYAVVSSTTSFYLPLVVMLVVYAKIYQIASRQAAEIKCLERSFGHQAAAGNGALVGRSPPNSELNRRLQKRSRRVNNDSKAIKTLGTLMGLFIISWLPFFLVYLILPFCPGCFVPPAAETMVTWLGYANSFINPWVYAFLNRDFMVAFRKILLCGREKSSPSPDRKHLQPQRPDIDDVDDFRTFCPQRSLRRQNGGSVDCRTESDTLVCTSRLIDSTSGSNIRLKILKCSGNSVVVDVIEQRNNGI